MIQGTTEWHAWRKKGLGGSDAPIIMNASPWKTRLELWHEKVTGKFNDISNLPHVMRGHQLEDKGRQWAEEHLGDAFLPICLVHDQHEEIRASFDGLNLERTSGIEIKCPGREDHKKANDGHVPDKYIWQLRHLMLVANLTHIYYISFDGTTGVSIRVERDEEKELELKKALLLFWKSIQENKQPDYSDRDFVPILNEEWKKSARIYLDAAKEIKHLEEKRETMKTRLIELAGSNSRVRGHGVQLSQTRRVGAIDYKRVPELSGVDLEPYRKAGSAMVTIKELDEDLTLS